MADCGVASRRRSEELIKEGLVSVNGIVVTELGVKIDPVKDKVAYKGKVLSLEKKKVYIMLNKPEGYVTTARDQFKSLHILKTRLIRFMRPSSSACPTAIQSTCSETALQLTGVKPAPLKLSL